MDFKHYYTNEELSQLLLDWTAKYPDLLQVDTIGQSYEGRPIHLLTLTNQHTGPDREKPAIWIDSNIHATEIAGTTAAMYIAGHLLEGYATDPQITRQLDQGVYYIIPRVNPDGAAWAMAANPKYVRSGVRPYPWIEKDEGLFTQDINGDGKILQMRLQDPNGDWKISSLDPRLMEKRALDEYGGTYYRLFPEGLLQDYDGYVIKIARQLEGLDFNRNFPFEWRPESDQNGAGPYPGSEPEIRSLVDFIAKHPNINLAITFHTFSRVILRPYSTKPDDDMNTEDLWVFKKIGELGTRITGYRCLSTFHDFKYHPKEVTTGAFDDWMYDHHGVFTYTIELWDLPTEAGIKDRKMIEWWREHPHEEDVQILKWIDEHGAEDAYVEWQPFDHPQLGKIELGGWNNMYTWRNPPLEFLEPEVKKHYPFILGLGEMLPQLRIHTLEIQRISPDKFHLNLVVENSGFLPTYTSQQGKARKYIRPVRVELELPDGAVLTSGKWREDLGHLEGRSNKLDLGANSTESPTDNRARLEWVIQAPEGSKLKLDILSERAGTLHKEVILEG
ncbi:MAG: M14 family metallopeptidase [Acidobacteriaceae bacterium]